MSNRSVVLSLAMAMLKRTLFDGDPASVSTIWRAQREDIREHWLRRAQEVLNDIALDGYEIRRAT